MAEYWNTGAFVTEPSWDWADVDARLRLPNDDQIIRLARQINTQHKGQHDETKSWPEDFRQVGLFCERAFCRVFEVPMDTAVRRFGSGRINATLRNGTTVDVVGRRMRPNGTLPDLTRRVKGHRQAAKVLVLVLWISRAEEPVFLGWLPDKDVKRLGVKQMVTRNNSENYVVSQALLRPMPELMALHDPASPLALTESMYPPDDDEETPDAPAQPGLF